MYVRTVAMRTRIVRQLRTAAAPRRWAAVSGVLAAAYRTQNGSLSVDIGQTLFSVVDDPATTASWTPDRARRRLEVDLPHVAALAPCTVDGRLLDASGHPVGACRLEVAHGRARIVGTLPDRVRTIVVAFGQTRSRARLRLGRHGRVRVVPAAGDAPWYSIRRIARRVWDALPGSLRRRFWLWRHRR
jgi:hypothetical protein